MKTDVIIVGAGPSGLSLACQLTRYGVDFIILDERENITPYSKAIGVQARTLEIYEQIDLAQSLIGQGLIAEKVCLAEGGEVRGEIELTEIGVNMSPYPFLLIVEQSRHEHLLYDFLKTKGKDVLWKSNLESFVQNETGVKAVVKIDDGEPQTIEAKFLVGCDGAKSLVRNLLGINFEGSTLERLFYVADVQIEWSYPHDSIYVCLAQSTITAFFPMLGENRFRIVGTFPENHQKDENDILYDEIERQIKEDTKLNLEVSNVNWFSVYKVHSRRVTKFSQGRCFLAGDAAHIHTPAGAQGMNTGIQDGYNLAWKLALVLGGRANVKLLETYNEERLANAARLLRTTDRMFEFGADEEWLTAFFRTHIFPYIAGFALSFDTVKKFIFPIVSQIGINYRNSSLSIGDEHFTVKAGDRMPFFLVEGTSIYKKLKEPKFHLLMFFDGTGNLPAVFESFINEYREFVDFHEMPLYPQITQIFGTDKSFVVILRPDNYIGFISSNISAAAIGDYFTKIAG